MPENELAKMVSELTDEQKSAVYNLISVFCGEKKDGDSWIGTGEAAAELGVTGPTIRGYLLDGKLQGRRVSPRRILVSQKSVEKLKLSQSRF